MADWINTNSYNSTVTSALSWSRLLSLKSIGFCCYMYCQIPEMTLHILYRCPVMASSNRDIASLGVQVTEGIGNLPKVVLSSVHGRYVSANCIDP